MQSIYSHNPFSKQIQNDFESILPYLHVCEKKIKFGGDNNYIETLASEVFEKLPDQDEQFFADILKFIDLLSMYYQFCV